MIEDQYLKQQLEQINFNIKELEQRQYLWKCHANHLKHKDSLTSEQQHFVEQLSSRHGALSIPTDRLLAECDKNINSIVSTGRNQPGEDRGDERPYMNRVEFTMVPKESSQYSDAVEQNDKYCASQMDIQTNHNDVNVPLKHNDFTSFGNQEMLHHNR